MNSPLQIDSSLSTSEELQSSALPRTRGLITSIKESSVNGRIASRHVREKPNLMVLVNGDPAGFGVIGGATAAFPDDTLPFTCELPAAKLRQGGLVTVVLDRGGELIFIDEMLTGVSKDVALSRPDDTVCTIHFDITDLLVWLLHHRHVSGIQRVQCGYLTNALAEVPSGFQVRVCAQTGKANRYVELPNESVAEMLRAIGEKRAWSVSEWRDYIETLRAGSGRAPSFRRDDIVFVMGAPWVHGDFFRNIDAAKREHGVRYCQIYYDLIPILLPEVAAVDLVAPFTRSVANMLRFADHIFSISSYSASDLTQTCRRIDMRPPPTSVIPLGGTLDYRTDAPMPGARSPSVQRTVRSLEPSEFVLCVGTVEPRKNHMYLYRVWKRLLADGSVKVPKLVCVGRIGWDVEELQRSLRASMNLDGHFVILSEVSDTELDTLYRDCLLTVFPSLYEGWGLPVTESLFYRKLCVTSGVTSMTEAGGDWAVYVDPYNVNDGFEKIRGLLRDRGKIAAEERRLRKEYTPRTWRQATRDLFAAMAELRAEWLSASLPPRRSAPLLTLGTLYSFALKQPTGHPLQQLRAEMASLATEAILDDANWHTREPWGCWSCGAAARLRFTVAAKKKTPLVCYLQVDLPFYAGEQEVQVLANGKACGSHELKASTVRMLRIDLPAAGRDGDGRHDYTLELRLDGILVPPSEVADKRLLGIGVVSLVLCERADLEARIAYLEQHTGAVPPLLPSA